MDINTIDERIRVFFQYTGYSLDNLCLLHAALSEAIDRLNRTINEMNALVYGHCNQYAYFEKIIEKDIVSKRVQFLQQQVQRMQKLTVLTEKLLLDCLPYGMQYDVSNFVFWKSHGEINFHREQ